MAAEPATARRRYDGGTTGAPSPTRTGHHGVLSGGDIVRSSDTSGLPPSLPREESNVMRAGAFLLPTLLSVLAAVLPAAAPTPLAPGRAAAAPGSVVRAARTPDCVPVDGR